MIVITGATGALNGATTGRLLDRVAPSELVVVTRDPAKAQRFADRGIEVRRGDYADPSSLPAAFAGADQLLLVSSNDPGADAVSLHRAAIEAAVTVGVGRVLYTSHQGAAPDTPFGPGRDHWATEEILRASSLPWTSLRNGFYLHSLKWLLGRWRETDVIAVPGEGPVSWTSRDDVAEAAAAVILTAGAHDGPLTLTATEAPTFEEVADLASAVVGRKIRFERQDPEDWVRAQAGLGTPAPVARFTLGMYEAATKGFFAETDPALATLLGREPETVREHLQESS